MAELRLHHTYARGAAVDVSDSGNHGEVTRAYPSPGGSTLEFEPPNSRVQVPPSDSLKRFRSIRARIRFRLDPDASPDRRYNLMEGHLSFALYVTPDFTLKGTIYDDYENWRGPTSDAGAVEPGRWHTAELTYVDSAARVDLRLDGDLVGSKRGVAGPVRPVGDLGVAIGIWPDADRYALDGQLDDAKLWATWPEFEDFVDPCCADTGALDRVVEIMRRDPAVQNREVDPTAILRGLQAISARVRAAIVGDDPERSEQVRRLEREFEDAYRERDLRRMLTTCASGYRLMLSAGVSSSAMVDEGREGIELLRRVELGRRLLDPFLEMDAGRARNRFSPWARSRPLRPLPDPPEEVKDVLGDAAGALCFPAPTKDEPLPSTEPEDNWGQIPHEPWPERPDHDPEEFERERNRRDDRDEGDGDRQREDEGDGDGETGKSKEDESKDRESMKGDHPERQSKRQEPTERRREERSSNVEQSDVRQSEDRPPADEEDVEDDEECADDADESRGDDP